MDPGKRLFTNALLSVTRRPMTVLITLFLVPFMLRHLGRDLYGIWSLTGGVIAYTGLLNLGLNSAVDYRVPRLVHQKDLQGLNGVVSSVMALFSLAALVGAGFVALVVWRFPDWFNIPPQLHATSRIVVVLVGASVVLHMPLSVYNGVLSGLQRYDISVGLRLAARVVSAGGVVAVLSMGAGLIGIAAVTMTAEIGVALCLMVVAYRLCTGLEVRPRHVDRTVMPGLLAYSVNTLMYGSGQLLVLQSGKVMAGWLYGPAAVTEFTIPFMLVVMVGDAARQAARPMKPAVSMLDAQDEREKIRQLFLFTTKYSLLIAVPATALLLLHGATTLRTWVGDELTEQSALLLSVMVIPQMLRGVNVSGFFVLSGLGKHRLFGAVMLFQSIAGVMLSYFLAEPGGLGLLGIALGLSLPELLGSGLIVPLYFCRRLGLRIRDPLRQCVLPALIAAGPFVVYCLAVWKWVVIETRAEFVLVFAPSILPLVAGAWFVGMGKGERATLKRYLAPNRRRAAHQRENTL